MEWLGSGDWVKAACSSLMHEKESPDEKIKREKQLKKVFSPSPHMKSPKNRTTWARTPYEK